MASGEPIVEAASGNGPVTVTPKSQKTKKATESKAKKTPAPKKSRNPSSHPPYEEMIKDAIMTLKERTGSSQYAISKFIEEKHKQLPVTFKKILLQQLKKLVAAGKLVKVKSSFKLPPQRSRAPKRPTIALAKKTATDIVKPKAKAAAATKSPAKSKPAAKPKSKPAIKPKAAAKPKATPAKPKAAAKPKAKESASRKVARTSARTSPGKKAATPNKKSPAVKKSPIKIVKPKTVKSPAKKAAAKGKKK